MCYISSSAEFDQELAEIIVQNARRYINIISEAVYEMLPDYKEREVSFITIAHFIILISKLNSVIFFPLQNVLYNLQIVMLEFGS